MKELRLRKLKGLTQGLTAGECVAEQASELEFLCPTTCPTTCPTSMAMQVFLLPLPQNPQLLGQFLENEASV